MTFLQTNEKEIKRQDKNRAHLICGRKWQFRKLWEDLRRKPIRATCSGSYKVSTSTDYLIQTSLRLNVKTGEKEAMGHLDFTFEILQTVVQRYQELTKSTEIFID